MYDGVARTLSGARARDSAAPRRTDRAPLASTSIPARQTSSTAREQLPTYDELKSREPSRFGRWSSWIEKRAREQVVLRDEDRQRRQREGRPLRSSWTLDDPQHHDGSLPQRQASFVSSEDEAAQFAASASKSSPSEARQRSSLGTTKLTPSTSIFPVGSRFLPQLARQPLCAAPLPLAPRGKHASKRHGAGHGERFLLLGTEDGLFVCDLVPSLSSAKVGAPAGGTDAKMYQLWSGLSIHQLEATADDRQANGSPNVVPGIVIGLVGQDPHEVFPPPKTIRMWPLQSSYCIDLSAGRGRTSKRASALIGLKHIFSPPSPDKGSSRDRSRPLLTRPRSADDDFVRINGDDGEAGPTEWASNYVPLDLTKLRSSAGGILSIRLFRRPRESTAMTMEEADAPRALKSWRTGRTGDETLYLVVATKALIFLLESSPDQKRTWSLASEMAVPFAPSATSLVLASYPHRPVSRSVSTPAPSRPRSSSSASLSTLLTTRGPSPPALAAELALAVSVRNDAVLIRLADLSVTELSPPYAIHSGQGSFGSRASVKTVPEPILAPDTGNGGRRIRKRSGGLGRRFSRGTSMVSASTELGGFHSRGASVGDLSSKTGGFEVESRRRSRAGSVGLGAIAGERRWTSVEEWTVPVGKRSAAVTYLCTRGRSTFLVREPFSTNRDGVANVKPLHTFTWRFVPVKVGARVVPSVPEPWSRSTAAVEDKRVFCCLTAVSATAVETREGFLSVDALLSASGRAGSIYDMDGPVFLPASTVVGKARPDEEEMSDTASYDYGSEIGWLCSGIAPWVAAPRPPPLDDDSDDDEAQEPVAGRGGEWIWSRRATGDFRVEWVG